MNTKKIVIFTLLIHLFLFGTVYAGGYGYVKVKWFNSLNQYIGEEQWQATDESEGWHQLYDDVTSPPNAAYAKIILGNQFDSQTPYVYFDDIGLTASGFRRTTCTASPECDENDTGEAWCDGNMKKTCDYNCGAVSQEVCRTDAEDTDEDALDPYRVKGECTSYLGCVGEECKSDHYQDSCGCLAKCYGTPDCTTSDILHCAAKGTKYQCEADSTCYWVLSEYKRVNDGCEREFINCKDYGLSYSCFYDKCTTFDINNDNYIGINDIFQVATHFGLDSNSPSWDERCDMNGDDYIGVNDIFL